MTIDWLSPAQCVGYAAFVLGVSSFVQKNDRRFKLFMAAECLAYIIHFTLLGRPTAVASSTMSLLRSVLALYTRSRWVALFVILANIGLGLSFATRASDWLPLGASCIGTLALFLMEGVRMRVAMLCGTVLWIVNNVIAGSVGGTALEVVIAAVNLVTIRRMLREAPAVPQA